jgi:hypothetical protein
VAIGDDGDQLSVTFVLHELIGIVAVDAARDESVRALVRCVPAGIG